jgi:hypothetical protein
VVERIKAEIPQITAVSQVNDAHFQNVTVNDSRYQIRSVQGVNESYADIMGLKLKEGRSLSAQDESNAAKVVVVSESLASVLFGGAKEALAGQIKVSSGVFQRSLTQRDKRRGRGTPPTTSGGNSAWRPSSTR